MTQPIMFDRRTVEEISRRTPIRPVPRIRPAAVDTGTTRRLRAWIRLTRDLFAGRIAVRDIRRDES